MAGIIIALALAVGVALAAVLIALPWLFPAQRRRHARSVISGAIDPFDEIWRPNGHEMKHIWEAEAELPAPAPQPGEKTFKDGKITLDL